MKRKTTWRGGWLLAVVLAGGCSSPQFSRIDSNRELYESWPLEVRQAVLDGKADKGMTPDMVRMAIGKPTEIVAGSSPAEEVWIYRTGGDVDQSMTGYPGGYPGTYPSGYPGTYPGTYPSTIGGTGIGVQPSIGISTGPGGTIVGGGINPSIGIGTSVGPATIGIGGGGIGMGGMGTGVMSPMPMPSSPVVDREVVFRDGVVYRADNPAKK